MSPKLPDPTHFSSASGAEGGGGGANTGGDAGSGGGGAGTGSSGSGGGGEPRDVRIVGGSVSLRTSSELLSFNTYAEFIRQAFCELQTGPPYDDMVDARAQLPFPDVHAYRALKAATEVYMQFACGVHLTDDEWRAAYDRDKARLGADLESQPGGAFLEDLWETYVGDLNGLHEVIPYLIAVRANLPGTLLRGGRLAPDKVELCDFLVQEKLQFSCYLELIWSYWHEEGLLVRSMDAISRRFQNKASGAAREPLAELELTPLRPLNNLLWGYIQDEQHRLTPDRRFYEYDHHYGLWPAGKRGAGLRSADRRSRFMGAFHLLVQKCAAFFKEDDDTTVSADAFPILNGLREVHILLAEGAHNQFGDLPSTSRQEMLIEQWLLARPEFDEFLPSRKSVVYPEPWMHRIEAMKRLHGWEQPSVRHYNNLARFGELLLLSIRYGNWAVVDDVSSARNWARFFREELQWYMHSYQAVTGVDLASGVMDVRQAGPAIDRAAQPGQLGRPQVPRAALGPGTSDRLIRPARRGQLRP
jgi:hypothetical protein